MKTDHDPLPEGHCLHEFPRDQCAICTKPRPTLPSHETARRWAERHTAEPYWYGTLAPDPATITPRRLGASTAW